jgi:hypothetical protein
MSTGATATDWFVDGDATGSGNGTSWANAYRFLNDALLNQQLTEGDQILVGAASTSYAPTDASAPGPDRCAAFELEPRVGLYGGFAGGEVHVGQRKPTVNVTILSGEIGGPGATDNSVNVVRATGTEVDADSILDGFTIRDGNASPVFTLCPADLPETLQYRGGGILVADGASPSIRDCTLDSNAAERFGGGIAVQNADPVVQACRFYGNQVTTLEAGEPYERGGGGLYAENTESGHTLVVRCCEFRANESTGYGGAISLGGPPPPVIPPFTSYEIVNCLFAANEVEGLSALGAAVYLHGPHGGGAAGSIANCTFADHTDAGAIFENTLDTADEIRNCIFWNNEPPSIAAFLGVVVSDSVVPEGWPGGTNIITDDPLFVGGGDYHLQPSSPAIDVGATAFVPPDTFDADDDGVKDEENLPDLDLLQRVIGGVVDMGAYEFSLCDRRLDLDGDETVGFGDLLIVLAEWGPCPEPCVPLTCPADLDRSCAVDFGDLLLVLSGWCEGSQAMAALSGSCLTVEHWHQYVDTMMDPDVPRSVKANWDCWFDHHLRRCSESCDSWPCPGEDPFGDPCGRH